MSIKWSNLNRWTVNPYMIDSRADVGVLTVQYVRQDPRRDGGPLGFLLSHLSLLAVSGYSWRASKACKESLFSCNVPSVVIHWRFASLECDFLQGGLCCLLHVAMHVHIRYTVSHSKIVGEGTCS